ncbi:MAG: pentapeptide repeat-containing protein [Methylocella sp.]
MPGTGISLHASTKKRARLIEKKRAPAEELTPFSSDELRVIEQALAKRRGSMNFILPENAGAADFSDVQFDHATFFSGYVFDISTFSNATFYYAEFDGATFVSWADFQFATFSGHADFKGTTFCDPAIFEGATFAFSVEFDGATFVSWAGFDGTTFSSHDSHVGFIFPQSFAGARFQESSSFVNAEVQGPPSFEGAIFETEPPQFFAAKLHQETVWRGVDWPKPKDAKTAGTFLDAYACLKLEMDRLKKYEEELDFFALELQSRRALLGWRGWPIWLYGVLSGYSRSYVRPLVAMFIVVAIGAVAVWYFDARTCGEGLGLSAANTLNVFGFRKDFFDAAVIECLPAPLKILSAVQTILGAILLFLFGLGVRNKFRMK